MMKLCGMQKRQPPRFVGADLTGTQFSGWTVLGPAPHPLNHKWTKGRFWSCRCRCGTTSVKATGHLTRPNIVGCTACTYAQRSSGRWDAALPLKERHELYGDLTGKRFGKRVVLGPAPKKENRYGKFWRCRCDCGVESVLNSARLRDGGGRGCHACSWRELIRENHSGYTGYRDISGAFWGHIKRQADKRALPFQITIQEAWELFEHQNRKCALTGVPIFMAVSTRELYKGARTASLDRIDSSLGYVVGNVQWVHAIVNVMKFDLPEHEFLKICRLIVARRDCSGPLPVDDRPSILYSGTASLRSGRRHRGNP